MKKLFLIIFLVFFAAAVFHNTLGKIGLKHYQDKNYTLDKVYPMDTDGTLDIKTHDAKVSITGSNRDNIHVKINRRISGKGINIPDDSEEFSISVTTSNGDVVIREHRPRSVVRITTSYNIDYRVEIELPDGASLKVDGDDDDYIVENINGDLTLNLDDGDVNIRDCHAGQIELDLEDGDLDLIHSSGILYATLDDGDLNAKDCNFKDVRIKCNDGDIYLDTTIEENSEYQIRTDDGDVSLFVRKGGGEFEIRHDDGNVYASSNFEKSYSNEHMQNYRLQGGNSRVFVSTNDGSVHLKTN